MVFESPGTRSPQTNSFSISFLGSRLSGSLAGTDPSLLRAAGAGASTVGPDVGFNRDVLEDHGRSFTTPDDIALLMAVRQR